MNTFKGNKGVEEEERRGTSLEIPQTATWATAEDGFA